MAAETMTVRPLPNNCSRSNKLGELDLCDDY
jgi:hypothetical protein